MRIRLIVFGHIVGFFVVILLYLYYQILRSTMHKSLPTAHRLPATPTTHLNTLLKTFLDQDAHKTLNLLFATQEIHNHSLGQPPKTLVRQHRKLTIYKTPYPYLAQMLVTDGLGFNFDFYFSTAIARSYHLDAMLRLPKPLCKGYFEVHPQQLVLGFTITAPNAAHAISVRHVYTGVRALKNH
ncbi:hypothetical protein [Spongiimicrobium sp. 3-5]|uniref:hypothetical protein n=1 Tax=Spongiimicrobium sp. 3-5 TaxID=3332596 RepID=UPI003980C5DF